MTRVRLPTEQRIATAVTSVSGLLGLQQPQGTTFDCCAVLILADAYIIINPRATQSLRWLVMSETYDPLHIVDDSPIIAYDCDEHPVSQEEGNWAQNEALQPECDDCLTHFCTGQTKDIDVQFLEAKEAEQQEETERLEDEEDLAQLPDILDTPDGETSSGDDKIDTADDLWRTDSMDTVYIDEEDNVVGFQSGDGAELESDMVI